MPWCFSTRASVATVLSTHSCISQRSRVKKQTAVNFESKYNNLPSRKYIWKCHLLTVSQFIQVLMYSSDHVKMDMSTCTWRTNFINFMISRNKAKCKYPGKHIFTFLPINSDPDRVKFTKIQRNFNYKLNWDWCTKITREILLTHWGLGTPIGDIDLGQHWLR